MQDNFKGTKLSALERRIMDSLKIEERHEQLSNVLPLYRRVTSALIPPLQYSIGFLHPHEDDSKEEAETEGEENKGEKKNPENLSSDEIDVACPLEEESASNSFLNALTTAVFYASAEPLKSYRRGPPKEKEEQVYSVADETNQGVAAETLKEETNEQLQISEDEPKFGSVIDEKDIHDASSVSDSDISSDTSTLSEARRVLTGSGEVPDIDQMTPWEKSVFQKVNLLLNHDQGLFSYSTEEKREEPDFEALPWYIANRLKKTFGLQDNDQFHGRFEAWLVRDVLLSGYIYLTSSSLCYYSLLPGALSEEKDTKDDRKVEEGALGFKLGHYGDSYYNSVHKHLFWAVLTSSNLCLYTSSSEMFFPVKVVDLKTASYCEVLTEPVGTLGQKSEQHDTKLSRSLSDSSLSQLESDASSIADSSDENAESLQGGVWFRIVCDKKSYKFHTRNIFTARHWCNAITKQIFQLKNSNVHREVVLKIPFDKILEFRKNFVLAEADEDIVLDNDTPVTFTAKYNTVIRKKGIDGEQQKNAIPQSGNVSYDFVHFLLFNQGKDVWDAIEKLLAESQKLDVVTESDESTQGYENRGLANVPSIISTLEADLESSMSIIDKIARVNEDVYQLRERERYKFKNGVEEFAKLGKESPEKNNVVSKILSKPMKRKGSSKIFCNSGSSGSTESSLNRILGEDGSGTDFLTDLVMDGHHLQFPRPFSVQTLKSLDLHMSSSTKSRKELEKNYAKLVAKNKEDEDDMDPFLDEQDESSEITNESVYTNETGNTSDIKEGRRGLKQRFKMLYSTSSIAPPRSDLRASSTESLSLKTDQDRESAMKKLRKYFHADPSEELMAIYKVYLRRSIPVYGRLFLGKEKLYFKSLLPGVSTKMILPLKNIAECRKRVGSVVKLAGISIVLHGREVICLEFRSKSARNECERLLSVQSKACQSTPKIERLQQEVELSTALQNSEDSDELLEEIEKKEIEELAYRRVREARVRLLEDRLSTASGIEFPLIIGEDPIFFSEIKSSVSYNFVLLTIGSRGDVQPYIALGKQLIVEGHNVTIATHGEFRDWIVSHGINFKEIAGNPAELMSLMVRHGSMSVGFLKEASLKFRGWVGDLLSTSWKACQGADVLIESPSAMGGLHIAEALGIPYMRAFTMPWSRTRAYPHAFIVPDQKRGGSYNLFTHVMFETVFWKGISGQVNKWRVETLGIPRTNLARMRQTQIPFLYNMSPEIFPPSVDFPDWVKVTGYWFLNEGAGDYKPPDDLVTFLKKARAENQKVVYIGFGSIVVKDAKSLTKAVVDAVLASGVRCVLNKGWSDKLNDEKAEKTKIEVELPEEVFSCGSVPHDWLFKQVDAAVHHGGSGTTGATLRSGLPTIIKPFFGDQFFYASRVEDLGVGLALKKLNAKSLANALKSITTNTEFAMKAQAIAENMKQDTGVMNAVAAIYSELTYAKTLIRSIRLSNEQKRNSDDDLDSSAQLTGSESVDSDL
ncbi:Sterol 3-beta-glucosyltransferase [Clavispora lusitaniae]|nr:Sterol 3-beta-glucosyltransferase [Clavispora lusitaniae]